MIYSGLKCTLKACYIFPERILKFLDKIFQEGFFRKVVISVGLMLLTVKAILSFHFSEVIGIPFLTLVSVLVFFCLFKANMRSLRKLIRNRAQNIPLQERDSFHIINILLGTDKPAMKRLLNQQTNQDREPPPCKKSLRPSHLSFIPGQAVASWQRVLLLPFLPSAIIIIIVNIIIIMFLPSW